MSTTNSGLWITKIFKDEFGFSDLRSNYSRTYSWMANQLGHMTLGLALVLFYFWIDATLRSAAHSLDASPWFPGSGVVIGAVIVASVLLVRWMLGGRSLWPYKNDILVLIMMSAVFLILPLLMVKLIACEIVSGTSAAPGGIDITQCPRAEVMNAVLLQIACAVAALGALALTWMVASKPHPKAWVEAKSKRLPYFWPLLRPLRRVFLCLVWAPFAWALVVTWSMDLGDRAEILGPVSASTIFGLAVLVLCKDWRVAVIGLFGIWISMLTAMGAPIAAPLLADLNYADYAIWIGGTLTLTMIALMVVKAPSHSNTRFDRVFYLMVAIVLGFWTYSVLSGDLSKDWRVQIAGSIASMCVWLVKEFGSDLPNVYEELLAASARRSPNVADDGRLLENSYIETAQWDARTDGSFYLAGALIGAGVLSGGAMITTGDGAWTVGAEILGLLIFGLIFIAGGRNWAYRQKAIDISGASRGNLLAVLDFTAELQAFDGMVIVEDELEHPRQRLYRFAVGNEEAHFSHLMVVGKPRLNQRFADALVTEAALKDLPPAMFAHLEPPEAWRRSRRLSIGLLLRYDIEQLTKAELPHTPIWDLNCMPRMASNAPLDPPIAKRRLCLALPAGSDGQEDTPKADFPDVPGAQLIAVVGGQPQDLQTAVNTIFRPDHPQRCSQTIWTFSEDKLEAPGHENHAAAAPKALAAAERSEVDQATDWAIELYTALSDAGRLGKGLAVVRLRSDDDE